MFSLSSVFLMFVLLWYSCASGTGLTDHTNLFFIKRNKNSNEVHYDGRVKNCTWDTPEVDSYWRELQEGPNVYEDIKWFEKPAYGFEVERESEAVIKISLNPLPERLITARLLLDDRGECTLSATMNISGKTADLRAVYVHARENFIGFPSVQYIVILGYSESGLPLFECLPETELGRELCLSQPPEKHWHTGATMMGRR